MRQHTREGRQHRWWIWRMLGVLLAMSTQMAAAQRVYLWQRAWTPAVCEAVRSQAQAFESIDLLAAELAFTEGGRHTRFEGDPDWSLLATQARKLTQVVRIGSSRSDWKAERFETALVLETCERALAAADRAGWKHCELQIDFDAATARLDNYSRLLEQVRSRFGKHPLWITALPTWLGADGFRTLLEHCDGYVLQVHSLEKPTRVTEDFSLCDGERARRWIAAAARLEKPFRVALPTYGYRMRFSAEGTFRSLQAETTGAISAQGETERTVMADSAAMAGLVSELLLQMPPHCEGIAWFRLPVRGDRLCWPAETLACVMRGEAPETRLEGGSRLESPLLNRIRLANVGDTCAEARTLRVSWAGAALSAGDGIGGWRIRRIDTHTLELSPPEHGASLLPQESRETAWLRFDREPQDLRCEPR